MNGEFVQPWGLRCFGRCAEGYRRLKGTDHWLDVWMSIATIQILGSSKVAHLFLINVIVGFIDV